METNSETETTQKSFTLIDFTPKHWQLLEQIIMFQPVSDANIICKNERRDLSKLKYIFRFPDDADNSDASEKWCVTELGMKIYGAKKIHESGILFKGESVFKKKSY